MTVRTRFAPSPTGHLHIGGARTALFNWLYARHHGGRFILRIEDTDRERSRPEFVSTILESMEWLGLAWDEGPYFQSERLARYREVVSRLLEEGKAYYCYCTKEELERMRAEQMARGEKPRYDGRCRTRREPREGVRPVIRFRNPDEGEVVVEDLIRGEVVFQNRELDDFILVRSDGTPTYNFTVVVDDLDMAITHVIRGEDHLPNTPRQINLIRALGASPPRYAHVPLILGPDGKRLSKRHGAMSVLEYRSEGYLPQALLNGLVRLGWAHGDQEIFSVEEMVRLFDVRDVNRSASIFNPEKLLWLNHYYLMHLPPSEIVPHLKWQLERAGLDPEKGPDLERLIEAQRERCRTLKEMVEASRYFFEELETFDEKARKKLRAEARAPLQRLLSRLEPLPEEAWRRDRLHERIVEVALELGLKLGQVGMPLRAAVTGRTSSPPIDLTLELLGKERTLRRIRRALQMIAGDGS